MANIIDGKASAASVIATVKEATAKLQRAKGIQPGLAVVIVGDDPASHAYVNAKNKTAKECGFNSVQHTLPEMTQQPALERLVADLNADPNIYGILVQLPLPKHLDADVVFGLISPQKDVDGLHVVNAGKIATGDLESGLISCTPAGAMLLVRQVHGDDLSGLSAVVVGRSNLFGKPMALLLLAANATVTIAHSKTNDLAGVCRNADIVVVAVGRALMVKADWIKPGATVIGVGINRQASVDDESKDRLVGDVDFASVVRVAGAITPVPGGVGPMTIAMLMSNALAAAERLSAIT